MSSIISSRAGFAAELSAAMTTSTFVSIGTLLFSPVIIIFDNQSTASVAITTNFMQNHDGTYNTWRTFPAGEALVLDLRAAHGSARDYTFDKGTIFLGEGTSATGNFSISYIYAINPSLGT